MRSLKFLGLMVMLQFCSTAVSSPQKYVVEIYRGITSLDKIGYSKVSYRYDSGLTGTMPEGWSGIFTTDTGIACGPYGEQNGMHAWLIHPPWRNGTGETDQSFELALLQASRITLRFSCAMQTGSTDPGKSDGATFRFFVNGIKKVDYNTKSTMWKAFQFDLTPYAGKVVNIRFETDPGPKRDPSFDFALWGNRELVVNGGPAFPSLAFKPVDPAINAPCHADGPDDAPTSPNNTKGLFRLQTTISRHPASFLSGFRCKTAQGYSPLLLGFGSWVDLVMPDGSIVRSNSSKVTATISQTMNAESGTVRRRILYSVSGEKIPLNVVIKHPVGDTAEVDVTSSSHQIAAIHFGHIGPAPYQTVVSIPYLGFVNMLPGLGLFTNTILDFKDSHASRIAGNSVYYDPLFHGTRNPVHDTCFYCVSNDILAVLPTPPNPPSPYIHTMSHLVVADTWSSGSFSSSANWTKLLASYGLNHLCIIVHVWQHGGYDNELPNVLPANTAMGGNKGMQDWSRTAVSCGDRFALHENYVDFYPNAPLFNWKDVAIDSNGNPQPAWKNLIQSYALSPDKIAHYSKLITTQVQADFGENAGYLDVHSAVAPWFHVDFNPAEPGAGEFHTVWESYTKLWDLFRKVHHGPVLGEGNRHWRWSGLLDGVEAQFGTGVPLDGGETAPLFTDFDLAKIHPLQLNHGMGYLERWRTSGYTANYGGSIPPVWMQDEYRMQEAAFGHEGFVPNQLWNSLVYVWQESHLMLPLTRRTGTSSVVSVLYQTGNQLMPVSEALEDSTPFNRSVTSYSDGVKVYVNGKRDNWKVKGYTLPEYGWVALGDGLKAGTVLVDGNVTDFAITPRSRFLNVRSEYASNPMPTKAIPQVIAFHQTAVRQFQIQFSWKVDQTLPLNSVPFIHVVDPNIQQNEGIVFQIGSGLNINAGWQAGTNSGLLQQVTLPADLPDGTYSIRTGLYNPVTGARLILPGHSDGSLRYELGSLKVMNAGSTIEFVPNPNTFANFSQVISTSRINTAHREIVFSSIATDNSFYLKRVSVSSWEVIPFDRSRKCDIKLLWKRLFPTWQKLHIITYRTHSRTQTTIEITRAGWVDLRTPPGVLKYVLKAE